MRPGSEPAEWLKIGTLTRDDITLAEPDEKTKKWVKFIQGRPIHFSGTIRWIGGKWAKIRLLQKAGFLTRPKCTYRTIKRFSAKRNRY